MTKQKLEQLLGRPLTAIEDANMALYLSIATDTLAQLICVDLSADTSARVYDVRQGYSSIFTDFFSSFTKVELDGKDITANVSPRQNDRRSGNWFNSLVRDCKFNSRDKEVSVTATWLDVDAMPDDLQMILAALFDQVSKKQKIDTSVQSKQVEDFRITFNGDADLDAEFMSKYSLLISKYSKCNVGYLRQEC